MSWPQSRFYPILALLVFALLPSLAGEQPLYFVQLSDPQFGMYSENKGFEQESLNYEFAIATANRLRPAFVVVTGDLVNRAADEAQVAEYLRISRRLDPSIPIYHVAGNHDVGNDPTPESIRAYRKSFGKDYYSFRAGNTYGIVLNSALMHSPAKAADELEAQEAWFKSELETAAKSQPVQIIVFQHHPYFIREVTEPDKYENIPLERRRAYLDLMRQHGVKYVFAGHYHQNAVSRYEDVEIVTTGPVGKPLGGSRSGMRVAAVATAVVKHAYFDFGDLPTSLPVVLQSK